MKGVVTIVAVCFLSVHFVLLYAHTPSRARIELHEREYDGGCISQAADTILQHKFVFSNAGVDTLAIIDVVTGCGCVKASCGNMLLPPGASDTIVVDYNPAGQRLGRFRKSVTIFCNDPRSYVRVFIQGENIE